MGCKKSKPHAGSRGYYPRKRAESNVPVFRSFVVPKDLKEVKPLNFYGYKAGMVHVMGINKHKNSPFCNQKVAIPATVIEFPPLTVFGLRIYAKERALKDFIFPTKANKFLSRRITGIDRMKEKGDLMKSAKDFFDKNKDKISELRLICSTNPSKTTIGQKVPDVIELHLSGKSEEQFDYFSKQIGQELSAESIFPENQFIDAKAVTVGKGFQGVIKRFGVKRRHHKSEKGVRRVGSIGPWNPSTVMNTVARPGQMGSHSRTELNHKLLKYVDADKINPKAGWEDYGVIRNRAGVFAGSLPGHVKKIVCFRFASRKPVDIKTDLSEITNIVL